MSDQLTDWIPGDVPPVREGVYERQITGHSQPKYALWNGRYWLAFTIDADSAERERISSGYQCFASTPWRGLAKESK